MRTLLQSERFLLEVLYREGEQLSSLMLHHITGDSQRHIRRLCHRLKELLLLNETKQRCWSNDLRGSCLFIISEQGAQFLLDEAT